MHNARVVRTTAARAEGGAVEHMHVLVARVRGEVGGRHEDQVEVAEEIAEVAAEIEIAIEIAATSRAAAEHPHAVRHPAERRGRRAGPRPALWALAPPLATKLAGGGLEQHQPG